MQGVLVLFKELYGFGCCTVVAVIVDIAAVQIDVVVFLFHARLFDLDFHVAVAKLNVDHDG